MAKSKSGIGFASWPFSDGEPAKLIKVSKPYMRDGNWYIDAEYLSTINNKAKFIQHFFGDLHVLIVGARYVNGARQDMPSWKTADIYLSSKWLSQKQYKPYLVEDKHNDKFEYYTFGFNSNKEYYIVSLLELVRAILAPDVFWLNQITLLDSIDTRILWNFAGDILNLDFSTDVPVRYVKMDSAIKHIAWIISNSSIYNMLEQLYQSIRKDKGILFDFLFEELLFTVKYEQWNERNYVREIVACKRKKIYCSDIIVNHPRLVEYENGDGESVNPNNFRQTKRKNADTQDKKLVSDSGATYNDIDIEEFTPIISEYSTFAKIKRAKISQERGKIDNNVELNYGIGTNKRTTADFGGLENVPQIEFANMTRDKIEGEFSDIYAMLKSMRERKEVKNLTYYVGTLNAHMRFRAICTLKDGITPRKYLVAKIQLNNGREAVLIEIHRENISLSTLVCVSEISQKWNAVCHKILKGLIENSGSWPDFSKYSFETMNFYRFKHTSISIISKEKRVIENIVDLK